MRKPKISVALATFNEEKNLPACLESVKSLADEIVVVDGSSTDKTVEIAKKYGAKVIVTDNPPIFHINKQKAIDACTGNWILQLDADERVTPTLREEILQVIANCDTSEESRSLPRHHPRSHTIRGETINGFWIPRRNYFLGRFLKKGGQYPDYTLRLYRRGKGWLPCKSVHEQAVVEGRVGYFKSDLLHFPYPDFREYLNKAYRYARLFADEYKRQKVSLGPLSVFKYLFLIPKWTFFSLYFRHKGFLDGFPGLVFALYSAVVRMITYVIYWEEVKLKK